jgi:hypothetical protein
MRAFAFSDNPDGRNTNLTKLGCRINGNNGLLRNVLRSLGTFSDRAGRAHLPFHTLNQRTVWNALYGKHVGTLGVSPEAVCLSLQSRIKRVG